MERWYRYLAVVLAAAALVASGAHASATSMVPAEHAMHAATCMEDASSCTPTTLPSDCAVRCFATATAPDADAAAIAVRITFGTILAATLLLILPMVAATRAVPLARAQSDPALLRTVIKRE